VRGAELAEDLVGHGQVVVRAGQRAERAGCSGDLDAARKILEPTAVTHRRSYDPERVQRLAHTLFPTELLGLGECFRRKLEPARFVSGQIRPERPP
jgi:hypothetical protein